MQRMNSYQGRNEGVHRILHKKEVCVMLSVFIALSFYFSQPW